MQTPPPLPKPIVTYELCDCEVPECRRMPMRCARDVPAEMELRDRLHLARALVAS